MIFLVDVQRLVMLLPLFDDPFETGRIAVHCCLVNWQIAVLIVCIPNLVFLAIVARFLKNLVKDFWFLVGAFTDYAHEGKLVLAHGLYASATATSHFILGTFCSCKYLLFITVQAKI